MCGAETHFVFHLCHLWKKRCCNKMTQFFLFFSFISVEILLIFFLFACLSKKRFKKNCVWDCEKCLKRILRFFE